jgi:hypothetical protein
MAGSRSAARCKGCGNFTRLYGGRCHKASCQEGARDKDLEAERIERILQRRKALRKGGWLPSLSTATGWERKGDTTQTPVFTFIRGRK